MGANCDNINNLPGDPKLFPSSKFWSFNLRSVPRYTNIYTDIIDLGENHAYTLLIARKTGNAGLYETLEIQASVDGVNWVPAAGGPGYPHDFTARSKLSNRASSFCVWGRPVGRYVRIYFENGSYGQDELIIDLGAFGGI